MLKPLNSKHYIRPHFEILIKSRHKAQYGIAERLVYIYDGTQKVVASTNCNCPAFSWNISGYWGRKRSSTFCLHVVLIASTANMSIEKWDIEIEAKQKWLSFNFVEMWRYRDLMYMFIKRDVVATYKQTILGPLWFFIQPLLTTAIFIVIFGRVAKLPTDGSPSILFYLGGVVMWQYFSSSLTATSNTFINNANIFGKVYFPRVILPLSTAFANLIKFSTQFILYVAAVMYYSWNTDHVIAPNTYLLLFPLLIVIMIISCLGIGMIITSLSIKYRDIQFLTGFGVQLFMYATPVIYPLSAVPAKLKGVMIFNPMCAVIEGTRFGFTGLGTFNMEVLYPALITSIVLFVLGLIIYNRMEKSFIDTV